MHEHRCEAAGPSRNVDIGELGECSVCVSAKRIAFVWENFGPMHNDRCRAVAENLSNSDGVIGIELFARSDVYQWRVEPADGFRKITLFAAGSRPSFLRVATAIVNACRRERVKSAFFCHYERPEIFIAALMLRATGASVFVMNDSKFDDYPRYIWRELFKRFAHMPYKGGIAAGRRSADYMRFLGHRPDRIHVGYDGISVGRIRALAAGLDPVAFEERDFLVVARLVPKKNIVTAIEAFRIFSDRDPLGRRLRICGAGPLEVELRAQVARYGLEEKVIFHGFEQIEIVAHRMAKALALLLPSTEEQYGLVVPEALALSLPVIVSENCGARDELVSTGVNGFVLEPFNVEGWAAMMLMLSNNEALWSSMSASAHIASERGDVGDFVIAVDKLTRDR